MEGFYIYCKYISLFIEHLNFEGHIPPSTHKRKTDFLKITLLLQFSQSQKYFIYVLP